MVAHVHTRVRAKEDTYTSAHTARTRNIRIRTCAMPLHAATLAYCEQFSVGVVQPAGHKFLLQVAQCLLPRILRAFSPAANCTAVGR